MRPEIVAYGVSDWPMFAAHLSPKISYINTQFDRSLFVEQPVLDITNPPPDWANTADLVICSEVLEHVAPPVHQAFVGLAALLKSGGSLVFSVPYSFEETVEHFPDLYDWTIEEKSGTRALLNTTRDGRSQRFDDLCFHGGGHQFWRCGCSGSLRSNATCVKPDFAISP